MTGKEINSCKKCIVCTGCGRGGKEQNNFTAVSGFKMDSGKEKPYIAVADMEKSELMIATDLGTTTIVMQLRRMKDGEVVDTFRAVNPQRKYGADVLSRIQAADENAAGNMRSMVLEVLEQGIRQFNQSLHAEEKIQGMAIAANTTMVHLLMGYPVGTLGKAPFVSQHLDEIQTTVAGVQTIIMPGLSAFVGADIVAGMYACDMGGCAQKQQSSQKAPSNVETVLFLDLGTNGEIVLGKRGRFLATATAAGPAFEGRLDANVWGADAVRFLANLYEKGLIDETGLLADEYFEEGVSIGSTVMTQDDIRSLQLAKAAVHAGIRVLCEVYAETEVVCIDKVYLAGGFGYFLNSKDAVTIGLLPGELEEKCVAVGNAALEGAFCYGRERFGKNREMARTAGERIRLIKTQTEVFNLAECPDFEKYYIQSINLPWK